MANCSTLEFNWHAKQQTSWSSIHPLNIHLYELESFEVELARYIIVKKFGSKHTYNAAALSPWMNEHTIAGINKKLDHASTPAFDVVVKCPHSKKQCRSLFKENVRTEYSKNDYRMQNSHLQVNFFWSFESVFCLLYNSRSNKRRKLYPDAFESFISITV